MQLKNFKNRLIISQEKKPELKYSFQPGITELEIDKIELLLDKKIPKQTIEFWKSFNGIKIENPDLEIHKIQDWILTNDNLIHFATFDKNNKIYFNTNEINSANQWSIITKINNYTLTLSMGSFWSNKIWHWIDYKTVIWKDKYWEL